MKGTLYSCLGEALWYLAGSNSLDYISYYIDKYREDSDDGNTIYASYGSRLINKDGHNQLENVINTLRNKPSSRQAVIQLFDAADIASPHKHVPCTCTLQFFVRNNCLDLVTFMRSNDAYKGLPHDLFAFTLIQELIASTILIEVGKYTHIVGSLHLYDKDNDNVKLYLGEGFQSLKFGEMPRMPSDPGPSVAKVLENERVIRSTPLQELDANSLDTSELAPYWKDLTLVLFAYKCIKSGAFDKLEALIHCLESPIYQTYLRRRMAGL